MSGSEKTAWKETGGRSARFLGVSRLSSEGSPIARVKTEWRLPWLAGPSCTEAASRPPKPQWRRRLRSPRWVATLWPASSAWRRSSPWSSASTRHTSRREQGRLPRSQPASVLRSSQISRARPLRSFERSLPASSSPVSQGDGGSSPIRNLQPTGVRSFQDSFRQSAALANPELRLRPVPSLPSCPRTRRQSFLQRPRDFPFSFIGLYFCCLSFRGNKTWKSISTHTQNVLRFNRLTPI